MALRIYNQKSHVYAGLAIYNPYAQHQVRQYAQSVSDLFKLMIQEEEILFRERILQVIFLILSFLIVKAADFVFGTNQGPMLLSDTLLEQFSLSAIPKGIRKPNSHLSLLAIVDSWFKLKIKYKFCSCKFSDLCHSPYDHLICQTPPFRLLLGITEVTRCFTCLIIN